MGQEARYSEVSEGFVREQVMAPYTFGKRTRVLHFLNSGGIGGLERSIYQLVAAFSNDDEFEMGVALAKDGGLYTSKIRELGVPVIDLRLSRGYKIRFDRGVLDQIGRYHIHHFHFVAPNLITVSLLAGRGGVRVITRRGGKHDYIRKYGVKTAVKYLLSTILIKRCFSGFSANTVNAAEFLREFYELNEKRVHVLYNGINFDLLKPIANSREILEKMNVELHDYKVGTACHLVGLKRVDLLIRAFHRCGVTRKRLLIFGKGEQMGSLKQLAKELGLGEQVLFMGEVKHMADYLPVLDCFVLASGKEESFGNAAVEAMYLQVPTIVMADGGGLLEHVIHEKTGFVAGDESELAGLIKFVFENRAVAEAIGRAASVYVQEKYTMPNMVDSYRSFYREIAGGGIR